MRVTEWDREMEGKDQPTTSKSVIFPLCVSSFTCPHGFFFVCVLLRGKWCNPNHFSPRWKPWAGLNITALLLWHHCTWSVSFYGQYSFWLTQPNSLRWYLCPGDTREYKSTGHSATHITMRVLSLNPPLLVLKGQGSSPCQMEFIHSCFSTNIILTEFAVRMGECSTLAEVPLPLLPQDKSPLFRFISVTYYA